MKETFEPTVQMPEGYIESPKGWMWILGFALAKCPWAMEIAFTDEFRQIVRKGITKIQDDKTRAQIEDYERRIEKLKQTFN